MTGKFLLPQIIDCHAHVGNLKGTTASPDNYTAENVKRHLQKFQRFGVGAILSMGTEQPLGIPLHDSSKAGLIPGEEIGIDQTKAVTAKADSAAIEDSGNGPGKGAVRMRLPLPAKQP